MNATPDQLSVVYWNIQSNKENQMWKELNELLGGSKINQGDRAIAPAVPKSSSEKDHQKRIASLG